MKALLASLLAAFFALAALSVYAAAPSSGMSAQPQTSLPADEDKDKDKDEGKKSD